MAIKTVWSIRTYDVWGNSRDGFDVNDIFSGGEVTIYLKSETFNRGTPQEFRAAYPSNRQIRAALGLTGMRGKIDTDEGDDLTIYVNRARDGYPLGELHCESHASLSPIRKAE